jgi:cellulose synthase/poly-beta-1,6-N-acetylglucosamine synthase-like glycosyltransferase
MKLNLLNTALTNPVPSIQFPQKRELKVAIENNPVVKAPKKSMYVAIFTIWVLALFWFEPRLLEILNMAHTPLQYLSLLIFILFIDFAWLYGIYNLTLMAFAIKYKMQKKVSKVIPLQKDENNQPQVAILYTTCNDFVEESALSCLKQDYTNYKLYILDDSTDTGMKLAIDEFQKKNIDKIVVVRRPNRIAFKAGNLNYALTHIVTNEKYFAIADADEIIPTNFLNKLVFTLENNPNYGFVQANHRANPNSKNKIQKDMGVGIDTHWKWHQPLRNEYGFVMFLGHGALLRYDCWKKIGGFPDIVSEDLGFAIAAREKGYRGYFQEDVTCFEDFPDSVRSFRIRHMKWTRGTCEFLHKKMLWLMKAKNISWAEKADILFPTLNLPLTLVFMLFMINANLLMPSLFGHTQNVTMVYSGNEFTMPITQLDAGFSIIYSWDFFLITILTFFSPVLCFIIALRKTPWKLFKFLSYSTALYASLSILSSIGVIAYLISGKAIFLVTGDKNQLLEKGLTKNKNILTYLKNQYKAFITKSHPDSKIVQSIEVVIGLVFLIAGIATMQISFIGLCFAFILLPVLHYTDWTPKLSRITAFLPFVFIILGLAFAGLSILGMQSVFFGYGFHF